MTDPVYSDEVVTVWGGDCIDVLRADPLGYDHHLGYGPAVIADCSIDAVVTDPPYGLEFMGQAWDRLAPVDRARADGDRVHGTARVGGYERAGIRYVTDGQVAQAWHEQWAAECLRVLKPGGHLLAFGGSRTWHRLACAVEDAGFEIRDSIAWLYGSGFPKSLDVSKAIDKAAGATREVIGSVDARMPQAQAEGWGNTKTDEFRDARRGTVPMDLTIPATKDARTWQGWGTALKPAFEPIVVARKPLTGTVAGNVLAHGTGAINVDGTRVAMTPADRAETEGKNRHADWGSPNGGKDTYGDFTMTPRGSYDGAAGRWPTNLILSHGEGCVLRGQVKVQNGVAGPNTGGFGDGEVFGRGGELKPREGTFTGAYGDAAGAELVEDWDCAAGCPVGVLGVEARFFPTFRYQTKAPGHERPGSTDVDGARVAHPTVKPLDLMRWLVRLVTPPGGTVLDPFLGSGTTAEAAVVEGMRCIGVERHPPYHALIRARLTKPIATVLW